MNWKPLLIGLVAGCIVTSVGMQMTATRSEPVVLHTIVVKTVDRDTDSPIPITGIRYPDHTDFSYSSAEPEKRIVHRVEYGDQSGITRIAWIGRGGSDEYRFILSAQGYEDTTIPSDFIKTTTGSDTGAPQKPDDLPMKKRQNEAEESTPNLPFD